MNIECGMNIECQLYGAAPRSTAPLSWESHSGMMCENGHLCSGRDRAAHPLPSQLGSVACRYRESEKTRIHRDRAEIQSRQTSATRLVPTPTGCHRVLARAQSYAFSCRDRLNICSMPMDSRSHFRGREGEGTCPFQCCAKATPVDMWLKFSFERPL